ncbi:MAG: bifunctional diaminohydroxyphosphoribosylaminopyrimidine deaminase/5-amino-6-(5-phosphoribosylamino)uracil reductase RibD [Acidaminococcales bacterium]|jgi:diaminohydroxyphosphoribosylaminopyrimidine deaminase/5-amino-6-(5-phosphoribosylamino)uracil reductase|nr:bifunctional diaminohydroxyphosphoribosylaminopyrimidine deaminase/5-amino-6-(5-phosphoribosylamino)uracil reductase RibD [Acidaminococcales bacterium]
MSIDESYMKRALELAAFARGRVAPNPMVGAVLVKDNKIVAEGWHEKAGTAHAEIVALNRAGQDASGATLYVTLEPCAHYGRTGPCADALIAAGIRKVFVAVRDPNPLVAGKGIKRLKEAGVEIVEGLLAKEAKKLNEIFFKWITASLPFVAMKYAMSLDGKIAAKTGDSKWISGSASREAAHGLRNAYDGIMVGIGTVEADDPALTCRIKGGRNPVRIVVDSKARISLKARLLQDALAQTVVAATELAPAEKLAELEKLPGVKLLIVPSLNGRVDLRKLLVELGGAGLTGILAEGGGTLHAAMLQAGLVDKLYAFIAPKIISGHAAPGPVGGIGSEKVADAWAVDEMEFKRSGEDILVTGYFKQTKGKEK